MADEELSKSAASRKTPKFSRKLRRSNSDLAAVSAASGEAVSDGDEDFADSSRSQRSSISVSRSRNSRLKGAASNHALNLSGWAPGAVVEDRAEAGSKLTRNPLAGLRGLSESASVGEDDVSLPAELQQLQSQGGQLVIPADGGTPETSFYALVEQTGGRWKLNLFHARLDVKVVHSIALAASSASVFERGAWPMARSGFYFGLQDSAGQGWVFEAETADARKDWLWLLAVRGADFSGVQSRRVFPAAHAEGYLRVQGSKRFKTVWETAYCVLHADSLMVFKDWRKAHAGKEQLSLKFSGSTRVSALEEPVDQLRFCFGLQQGSKKATIFSCMDEEDQRFWTAAIAEQLLQAEPSSRLSPSASVSRLVAEDAAGWMWKPAANGYGWKHRFCALVRPGSSGESWVLRYFKEFVADPADKKGQGSIKTEGAKLMRFARGIYPRVINSSIWGVQAAGTKRTFHFECSTSEEREQWLNWMVERGAQRPVDVALEHVLKTSAKEGYMEKMGATEKASGWKVRYFVIDKRDKVIRYFEQREKAVRSQNNSLKQLPLTSDTVLTALKEPYLGKDFVFKVVLPGDSRQWLFSVADEAERQSWLDALQSVVGLDAAALLVLAQKAKQNLRHQRSQTMLDSQLMSPLRSDSDTLGASFASFNQGSASASQSTAEPFPSAAPSPVLNASGASSFPAAPEIVGRETSNSISRNTPRPRGRPPAHSFGDSSEKSVSRVRPNSRTRRRSTRHSSSSSSSSGSGSDSSDSDSNSSDSSSSSSSGSGSDSDDDSSSSSSSSSDSEDGGDDDEKSHDEDDDLPPPPVLSEEQLAEIALSGKAWICKTEESSGQHYWLCPATNRMSWLKPVDLDNADSDFERGEPNKVTEELVQRALDPHTRPVFTGVTDVNDFRCILGCEEGRASFMVFLEGEYSTENLKFWIMADTLVKAFKDEVLEELDLEGWSAKISEVFHHFVLPEAEDLINISSDTSRRMIQAFREFESAADKRRNIVQVMDEIQNGRTALYELMAKDSFSRYVLSDIFKEFVRDYHAMLSKLELRAMKEAAEMRQDGSSNQDLYLRLTQQSTNCSVLNCNKLKERANFCVDHARMFASKQAKKKGNFILSAFKGKKDRTRLQEHGFDLDLGYVTPNVITMGVPSGRGNPLNEVREYLKLTHENCFRVYNFSLEKFEDDTYKSAGGSYLHLPGEEGQPPLLKQIVQFCEDAAQWLSKNHEHVIVCHCRAGMGRTATMVGCLLLYTQQFGSVTEALQTLADRRTLEGEIARMMTASQRQYAENFALMIQQPGLCGTVALKPPAFRLKQIIMSPVPVFDKAKKGCCPRICVFTAYPDNGELYDSNILYEEHGKSARIPEFDQSDRQVRMKCLRELNGSSYVMIRGDVKILLFHTKGKKKTALMFSTSLHTAFLPNTSLTLTKDQLDGLPSDPKSDQFPADFSFTMKLERV